MHASSILALAAFAAGAFSTVSVDAATRHRYRYAGPPPEPPPFVVHVQPRSFLDPGPIVPVGSLSKYVYDSQYHYTWPWSYTNHYGHPPLPRCGAYSQHLYLCPPGAANPVEGLSFGPLSRP